MLSRQLVKQWILLPLGFAIYFSTHADSPHLSDSASVAQPGFSTDSVEPAPRRDSVVRGVIINNQLFGLGEPYRRGLGDIKEILYAIGTITSPLHDSTPHGDAWSLCYHVHWPEDSAYIYLWSDAEMGGAAHDLQGIDLSVIPPPHAQCTPIRVQSRIVTDNGLYLGMTLAQLRKVMGVPTSVREKEYGFDYARVVKSYDPRKIAQQTHKAIGDTHLPRYVKYDINASVRIRIQNGRVVKLSASYLESY